MYKPTLIVALIMAAISGEVVAAEPLRISGQTMRIQTAMVNLPAVERHGGRLQFMLQRLVTVSGWPANLPDHLGKQTVELQSMASPAGPVTYLRFTRPGDNAPWLIITSRGQSGTLIAETSRLRIQADRVFLTDQNASERLVVLMQPVVLRDNTSKRWQFGLLDVQPTNGGPDSEARASWYLRKL